MFILVHRDGCSLFIEFKPYDFCIYCLFLFILLSAPAGFLSLSALRALVQQ